MTTPYSIIGIKHTDNSPLPCEVKILKGGIGHKNVTIQLQPQQNAEINSEFTFYSPWTSDNVTNV